MTRKQVTIAYRNGMEVYRSAPGDKLVRPPDEVEYDSVMYGYEEDEITITSFNNLEITPPADDIVVSIGTHGAIVVTKAGETYIIRYDPNKIEVKINP